jgi:hypothetical protein
LGADLFAEIDNVRKALGGKIPLLIAYSGGEMCPTKMKESPEEGETAINRFHNNTLIACVF